MRNARGRGEAPAPPQVFLHIETDAAGEPKRYPRSAVLDPTLRNCGSMPHTVAYEPSAEEEARLDRGLFLINVDRLRTVELVRCLASLVPLASLPHLSWLHLHSGALQPLGAPLPRAVVLLLPPQRHLVARRRTRTTPASHLRVVHVTAVGYRPVAHERLELVLELQQEALRAREGMLFCTMPEFSGLSDSVRPP